MARAPFRLSWSGRLCLPVLALSPLILAAGPASANDIYWSASADRTNLQPLNGASVYGPIYVVFVPTWPLDRIAEVEFFVDGSLVGKDKLSPFDLAGETVTTAKEYDTVKQLQDGPHVVEAAVYAGGTESVEPSCPVDADVVEIVKTVGARLEGSCPEPCAASRPSSCAADHRICSVWLRLVFSRMTRKLAS